MTHWGSGVRVGLFARVRVCYLPVLCQLLCQVSLLVAWSFVTHVRVVNMRVPLWCHSGVFITYV